MKSRLIFTRADAFLRRAILASLVALIAVAGFLTSDAASSNPPDFLTYQGYLADGSGLALAQDTPVNYNVVFRIYDSQSGGTLLWAEVQTVTVDKGYFSTVLGEGAVNASEPRPPLSAVFTNASASDRFLDMTVTIGGSSLNIAPRLRFLPSPYAFLARHATALTSPTGSPLVTTEGGVINFNGTVSNAGAIANSATTATSANVANTIVQRDASGNFAANHIFVGVGLSGPSVNAGHLHAGTYSPTHPQGAHLEWNHSNGGGETWILNQRGGGAGGIAFGEVDGLRSITERMRIRHDGRVGIGSNNPDAYLTVVSSGQTGGNNTAVFIANGINSGRFASHLHYGATGDVYWRSADGAGKVVLQDTGGNVGIGTANPLARLDVAGMGQFAGAQIGAGAAYGFYGDGGNIALRTFAGGGTYFQTLGGARTDMLIDPAGNVVIGSNPGPQGARLAVLEGFYHNGIYGAYINVGGAGGAVVHGEHLISIYAQHSMWVGNTVIVSSDERIKNIQGRSNSASDLETLLDIEITDYQYKDQISNGDSFHKKVIAQQVEEVFPQAITMQTNVIPDIFETGAFQDGWVSLSTDLKVGDRVRLIGEKDKDTVCEVLEIGEDSFRVSFETQGDQIFVYGREVDDFRVVDYDAISMLNVSATQELAEKVRVLEAKAARVDALEKELADLKKLVGQLTSN